MSSTHDAQTVTLDPTTAQFDEQQTVADLGRTHFIGIGERA